MPPPLSSGASAAVATSGESVPGRGRGPRQSHSLPSQNRAFVSPLLFGFQKLRHLPRGSGGVAAVEGWRGCIDTPRSLSSQFLSLKSSEENTTRKALIFLLMRNRHRRLVSLTALLHHLISPNEAAAALDRRRCILLGRGRRAASAFPEIAEGRRRRPFRLDGAGQSPRARSQRRRASSVGTLASLAVVGGPPASMDTGQSSFDTTIEFQPPESPRLHYEGMEEFKLKLTSS